LDELVLDASVVGKWLHTEREERTEAALRLRQAYEAGQLIVVVPPLLSIELLNVAARRWRVHPPHLFDLARTIIGYGFVTQQPDLENVARWTARGLTAYDASYVALAEERRTTVVTDDRQMVAVGSPIAIPLA
jgi:predicted nucleic acid-binding protein